MNKITFQSQDGLTLVGVWHMPKMKTSTAIILAHGITVDKDEDGIFIKLAQTLEKNGYAVFRFDFRGHGESEGKSIDLTIAGEILDLKAAVQEVKNEGYTEIGLLGASFGGGSAALYAASNQDDIRCLCLWNPSLNYDHTFLHPTLPWIRERKKHMAKDLAEQGWTTLGSRKYVIGKQLFDEMAQLQPFSAFANITIPTMILHGDKDAHVPYEDSKEYVTALPQGELVTIIDAEHGFHEVGETDQAIDATLHFFHTNL